MIGTFLQSAGNLSGPGAAIFASAALTAIFIILSLGVYVYVSFAFMRIGRKVGLDSPGLAWIPAVGPYIISYQSSGMHWWPWLLLIGMFIPIINIVAYVLFAVFVIIWQWKMFEEVERPGWWSILTLIPVLNFILYGVAAWGSSGSESKKSSKNSSGKSSKKDSKSSKKSSEKTSKKTSKKKSKK
ncbi:MAG: hypothetical protein ABEI74_02755 [Candidatus Pacearchaeota archaeon]